MSLDYNPVGLLRATKTAEAGPARPGTGAASCGPAFGAEQLAPIFRFLAGVLRRPLSLSRVRPPHPAKALTCADGDGVTNVRGKVEGLRPTFIERVRRPPVLACKQADGAVSSALAAMEAE